MLDWREEDGRTGWIGEEDGIRSIDIRRINTHLVNCSYPMTSIKHEL